MSKINDGGPAFPPPFTPHPTDPYKVASGLTLRDFFACQALPKAMDLDGAMIGERTITHFEIAEYAYAIADAMLEAREVK